MEIILISGKAMSGKDTSAIMIKEQLEAKDKKVLIAHYADAVKFICTKYFDWDGNKDEKGRTILQRIGTDVVRTQEPDYWVGFVKSVLELFPDEWDYVLIPDCRFANEVESFKRDGWPTKSVRITRTNFESSLTEEQKNHISETALDYYEFDYYVYSESGLEELEQEIIKLVSNWEV